MLYFLKIRSGIATTLNVEGCIEEKVGRDLYRVSYGHLHVTLFAAEMVPNTVSTGNSAIDVQRTTTWEPRIILDKICVYADMQRSFFSARRKYKQELHSINMERKIKDIGYNFTLGDDVDLTSLFYIALDCGFLSTVTEDDQWNKEYSTSLLAFLQEKRFHYFLSGSALGVKLYTLLCRVFWRRQFHCFITVLNVLMTENVPMLAANSGLDKHVSIVELMCKCLVVVMKMDSCSLQQWLQRKMRNSTSAMHPEYLPKVSAKMQQHPGHYHNLKKTTC